MAEMWKISLESMTMRLILSWSRQPGLLLILSTLVCDGYIKITVFHALMSLVLYMPLSSLTEVTGLC